MNYRDGWLEIGEHYVRWTNYCGEYMSYSGWSKLSDAMRFIDANITEWNEENL